MKVYIVGFIDDSSSSFDQYEYALKQYDIEFICTDKKMSKEEVFEWILKNKIEFLFIDYKLKPNYSFQGTELVAFINQKLPDMQAAILTNHIDDSINEKIVSRALTFDRNIFNKLDVKWLADIIINYIEIFKNRLLLLEKKYEELLEERKNRVLTVDESNELKHFYKVLKTYGEIDDIPSDFIDESLNDTLDKILNKLDKILDGN